ncbi:MAG: hypothetical protein H7838_06505 [Magnetococcus sp. DMHC-8]
MIAKGIPINKSQLLRGEGLLVTRMNWKLEAKRLTEKVAELEAELADWREGVMEKLIGQIVHQRLNAQDDCDAL